MAVKKKIKGSGSDDPFTFTTSLEDDDGKPITITVPSLSKVEVNEFKLHLLRKEDPSGLLAQDYVIRLSVGDDQADDVLSTLAELPPHESNEFQSQWTEHSGTSLGESKASVGSRGSSGRR